MKVVHADGKTEIWKAKAGESGWLQTEGPHTSENIGKKTMGFVLVEVKGAANPTTSKALKPKAPKSSRRATRTAAAPV
jgi:oxalate decarboxylase/phosphoglucose isomerase-like protein (cupin superfamily)